MVLSKENGQLTIDGLLKNKNKDLYNWIQWVIFSNLPISFVENEMRKFSKLEITSRQSVTSGIFKIAMNVEEKIKEFLPEFFGIVFDGWSCGRDHYLALFAVFNNYGVEKKNKKRTLIKNPVMIRNIELCCFWHFNH